jgi:anti-sigma factor RsiW
MARRHQTTTCEQAGEWISLRLDDELSELEQAKLDRHLEQCAGCAAFAVELSGISQLLRAAPLVAFDSEPDLVTAAPAARRSLLPVRARQGAYALVTTAAAAVVAFLLLGSSESIRPSQTALHFRSAAEKAQFLRVQQLRIEPRDDEPDVTTPPRMNPLRLL